MNFRILIFLISLTSMAQELPFSTLPPAPEVLNVSSSLNRMIQGLGFRFYWATEGLRSEDLTYRPSADAQNTIETIAHIYGLSDVILKTLQGAVAERPPKQIPTDFITLRKETLLLLEKASNAVTRLDDNEIQELKIQFLRGDQTTRFPIWNLYNGPLSDALYHTGQVVSFRRSSGNPIAKGVNVFLGIKQ